MYAIRAGMQVFGLAEYAGRAGDVDGFGAVECHQYDIVGRNRGFVVIVTRRGHA
jgi:hypothetical protein